MKVSDDALLIAVWQQMVRATARGSIDHYVGNRKGIRDESMRCYAQDIHIVSRHALDVPLSLGHLRKRLVRLIDSGRLQWVVHGCTFWINDDRAKGVFEYARDWWAKAGVPSGFDQERKACRCKVIEGYDYLADQLEQELLTMFGHGATV